MAAAELLLPLALASAIACYLIHVLFVSPILMLRRLRQSGFDGPTPSFPLGNLREMKAIKKQASVAGYASSESAGFYSSEISSAPDISHDIHPVVFPYFSKWRKTYGKVFLYWMGAEPFLYVADPEFLKLVTGGTRASRWGKPNMLKLDRNSLFGNGLLMSEGDEWAYHRSIVNPAFSSANLNAMISTMVDSTTTMIDSWMKQVASGANNIDVQKEITWNAAEIIARTSFGADYGNQYRVAYEKMIAIMSILFTSNRFLGVPFSRLLCLRNTVLASNLGKEVDQLLMAIIKSRRAGAGQQLHQDLLGLLLAGRTDEKKSKQLSDQDLVDECKTIFIAGHETTALALTWTLLLLALYPEWQRALREESLEVCGVTKAVVNKQFALDLQKLDKLTKMGWVFDESIRLYSPGPNLHRQAREDIKWGDVLIPKGTNLWVDIVGMNHDRDLWGDDVNQFRPERFSSELGGCSHRCGFVPFGVGGRLCLGRNLARLEFKVVLCLVLQNFCVALSPGYHHAPTHALTMRPSTGVQLVLQPLGS